MRRIKFFVPLSIIALALTGCNVFDKEEGEVPGDTTKVLDSIVISQLPSKRSFEVDETFTYDGLKVTAVLKSKFTSTTQDVSNAVNVTAPDMSTAGANKEVNVAYTYEGVTKNASYTVTVNEPDPTKVLQSIAVATMPSKTTFTVGEEFTSAGLKVNATFSTSSGGLVLDVTNSCNIIAPSLTSAGNKTVSITYTYNDVQKSTSYNITVNEPVVEKYTVSFNANGGTGTMSPVPNIKGSYTLPACTFTPPGGHYFDGWKVNNSGSKLAAGSSYDVQSNITLYAQWETDEPVDPDAFTLLESGNLEIGSYVVFANNYTGSVKIMAGFGSTNNNRTYITSTVNSKKVNNLGETAAVCRVDEGTVADSYSFYDLRNKGYLAATGGTSNNYLKLESSKSANSSFKFTYSSGGSTLSAQGNTTNSNYRGTILYNSGSTANCFSCYKAANATQSGFYKLHLFVAAGETIYPESITISGSSTVNVGEDVQLSVSYAPSNTNKKVVSWESNETGIATVSNTGLVHGVSDGVAQITVKALKEDNTYATDTMFITVNNVPVTGVSLNKATASLSLGKTLQLSPTISPTNATNKDVTYSSSNSSIAKVSTSGVVTPAAVGSCTITVTTVDGGFTDTCVVTVTSVSKDEWTILLYVCGADLESGYANDDTYDTDDIYTWCAATGDIKEILSVGGKPSDVNIIIQTGGANAWSKYSPVDATKCQRWEVSGGSLVNRYTDEDQNMGESSTLQSFLTWGLTEYPADKTGLILWNHGGAMGGVCLDENHDDDSLSAAEVHTAVGNALAATGNSGSKLEFIGYDACLMGVADIASVNADYFNYMVASQETEPGYGWDYTSWLVDLYAKESTETVLSKIASSYKDFYENEDLFGSNVDLKTTQAVYDLSKMDNFISAFQTWSSNFTTSSHFDSLNSIYNSNSTLKFGYSSQVSGYLYGVVDALDFVNKVKANSSFSSINNTALKTAISELVIHNEPGSGYTSTVPCGVCIFMAAEPTCGYWPQTLTSSYTTNDTKLTTWRSFNIDYGCWYK